MTQDTVEEELKDMILLDRTPAKEFQQLTEKEVSEKPWARRKDLLVFLKLKDTIFDKVVKGKSLEEVRKKNP